jgi:hypothetical protein
VAEWGEKYYTVTFFDTDTLTVLKTEQVLEGGNATPPPFPDRPGWVFSGWSGYTNVVGNLFLPLAGYDGNS